MNHRFKSLTALAVLTVALAAGDACAQALNPGYTENFETFTPCGVAYSTSCPLPGGWTNLTSDDFDWLPDVGGTGSTGTGPSVDVNPGNSTGTYLYTETSGGTPGVQAILESPRFNALNVVMPRIKYWYHMWGADMGNLHVDAREFINEGGDGNANGTTFITAFSANFSTLHIGTSIIVSGSGAGNDGVYTIVGINSFGSVEVSPAFVAPEIALTYVHEVTHQDIVPVKSGDMGDVWLQDQIIVPLTRGGMVEEFHIIFRGERGNSFTSDMAIDQFEYDQVLANDLAITSVTTPSGLTAAGIAVPVTVTILNNGLNPQSSFSIQYDLNASGSPIIEPYTGPTILPGASESFTFATSVMVPLGASTLDATVLLGDAAPYNDSASSTIQGVPFVNTFPYVEDFEASDGNWAPGGSLSSWEYGTPAKPVINAAASGLSCWTNGGLTGQYNTSELSTLTGPIFDLSSIQAPFLRFNIWWEAEFSNDGLAVETSIDGGASWQVLGSVGGLDSANWYNDTTIFGLNPTGNQQGFTGRVSTGNGSGGYVSAVHALGSVAGNPSVLIRFIFGANTGTIVGDGIAIDDIEIFDQGGGLGQAPQRDLAVLDINTATDLVGGYTVSSGVPGVYSA
ncbi:MAG: hypothetical protein KDB53_12470 [Planctomycetes bacterium]|nr:hypothetical protein [Planctomycetota bacterium]